MKHEYEFDAEEMKTIDCYTAMAAEDCYVVIKVNGKKVHEDRPKAGVCWIETDIKLEGENSIIEFESTGELDDLTIWEKPKK